MKNKMTISKFAKLCNTTKATLRWYYVKDLLQPSEIGENGYFYYKLEQIVDFNVIQFLQDLGYSLDQIKKYMTSDESSTTLSLEDQITELSQQIDTLIQRRELLTTIINNQDYLFTHWGVKSSDGDFRKRYFNEEYYLISHAPIDNVTEYLKSLEEFQKLCHQIQLGNATPIITFFTKESLINREFNNGYHIGTRISNPKDVSDKLVDINFKSDLELKIITRKSGKYFVYLTKLQLHNSDNEYGENPMIIAQNKGLDKAIQKGASLEMGMLETVVDSFKNNDGSVTLFLEISLFCS